MTIARLVSIACAVFAAGALAQVPSGPPARIALVPSNGTPPAAGLAVPAPADTGSRFDQRLGERVVEALSQDPAMLGAEISVMARDGNVALLGTTVDSMQASRAQQLADAIAGVGHASSSLVTRRP